MVRDATIIDGISFVSIENVLKWKKSLAREKDLVDVSLIENFLSDYNNDLNTKDQ